MQISVIIDNRVSGNNKFLCCEHGLSIYFELAGKKWLFDTGASDSFILNAKNMGIQISEVDYLVLSHGHNDHTGGLRGFLALNRKATVFLSRKIAEASFYSYKNGIRRNISTEKALFSDYKERFSFIDISSLISGNIGLVPGRTLCYPQPLANRTLYISDGKGEKKDDFLHELALVVKTDDGLVIFSACTHLGIQNTIKGCCDFMEKSKVKAFIGGAHLIDGAEKPMNIRKIAAELKVQYPECIYFVGHCTGNEALSVLSSEMGDKLQPIYSGFTFSI